MANINKDEIIDIAHSLREIGGGLGRLRDLMLMASKGIMNANDDSLVAGRGSLAEMIDRIGIQAPA